MTQGEPYCPTPREIAAACAEIRKTWSADDWVRRAGGGVVEWNIPCFRVDLTSDDGARFTPIALPPDPPDGRRNLSGDEPAS